MAMYAQPPNDSTPLPVRAQLAARLAGQPGLPNGGIYQGPSTPISDGPSPVQSSGARGNAAKSASSGASATPTAGFDPNNPIDAVFLKNGYANNGAGSGFGDLAYWEAHPDQAARLDADQRGVGSDQPGPKDTGVALGSGRDARTAPAGLSGPGLSAGLDGFLGGNAFSNINQALGNIGAIGGNAGSMLQQLITALGGGG